MDKVLAGMSLPDVGVQAVIVRKLRFMMIAVGPLECLERLLLLSLLVCSEARQFL